MSRTTKRDLRVPGIYPDVPWDEYLALDAVRSTHLRDITTRTPAHCRFYREHGRKVSDAMKLGSAVNHQLLEPQNALDGTIAIWDERTANGATWPKKGPKWEAFQAANQGRTVIDLKVWDEASYIAAGVRRNPVAARMMSRRRVTEVTITWLKAERLCAARLDVWCEDYSFGDLKVSGVPLAKDKFSWHARSLGWHQQAAWYDEGLRSHDIHPPGCALIAVESKPPHCCIVYRWPDNALQEGYDRNGLAFDQLLECERTGQWPGYPHSDVLDGGPWREDDDKGLDLDWSDDDE